MTAQPDHLKTFKIRRLVLMTVNSRDHDQLVMDEDGRYPALDLHPMFPELLEYAHFPALLLPDGSPWVHGNLYLLSKISDTYHKSTVDEQTLAGIASELKSFIYEITQAGLNYLEFPTRKLRRPTYFYAALLKKRYEAGEIEDSTRRKKLNSVFGMYSWLKTRHDFNPENSLWDEKTKIVTYLDERGFPHQKTVKSNSLIGTSVKSSKTATEGYISDDGALRPYTKDEQDVLLSCLSELDNTELSLMCAIALTTGARIQTVLTLRTWHLVLIAEENGDRLFSLKVGNGTGIDTKFGKRFLLKIPEWLHYALRTYVNSPRYAQRKERASEKTKLNEYVFLTEDGLPYYAAKDDPANPDYKNIPKGDALRQTIRRSLQPAINRSNNPFHFRFHDLRATFGMNLVEDLWRQMDQGEFTFMQILNISKERLAHSRIETTLLYFNNRMNLQGLKAGYDAIESKLKAMV